MPYASPLRYPGGKQKLAPFILEVLAENGLTGGDYVEPYAGGAGIAVELLLANHVSHIHLNDSCYAIYAFWRSILNDADELCRRVRDTPLTVRQWRLQREILLRPAEFNQIDVGFSAFYLNRCNRSGILAGGGLIGGLAQAGKWRMDARFPRSDLIARIKAIAERSSAITVKNWDAEKFLLSYVPKLGTKTLLYCDPPYFHKGNRLYFDHYTPEDHARVAQLIQTRVRHLWLVSYDGTPHILKHYWKRRTFLYDLQYNAADVYKGKETFIFSDKLKIPDSSSVPAINFVLEQRLTSMETARL